MTDPFSRETLEEMWNGVESSDEKLDILFRISLDTAGRIKKLETRKRFDTAISSVTGLIGGALAYLGTFVFRGKGL